MEKELANHLTTLCAQYCEIASLKETTVGKLCAADGKFFPRIRAGQTFTAKKYDEVVMWFARNWPSNSKWPEGVPYKKDRAA